METIVGKKALAALAAAALVLLLAAACASPAAARAEAADAAGSAAPAEDRSANAADGTAPGSVRGAGAAVGTIADDVQGTEAAGGAAAGTDTAGGKAAAGDAQGANPASGDAAGADSADGDAAGADFASSEAAGVDAGGGRAASGLAQGAEAAGSGASGETRDAKAAGSEAGGSQGSDAAEGTMPEGAPAAQKVGVPTVEKTVSVNGGPYGKAVCAGSWEQLGYRIEVRLPESLGDSAYPLKVLDVLPAGIRPDQAREVSVSVGRGGPDAQAEPVKDGWTADWDAASRTLSVDFPDAAKAGLKAGDSVFLDYFAYLDPAAAECGAAHPNTNSVTLLYPDESAEGGMGRSVPSVAHAHTFAVKIEKRGQAGDVLAGAAFELRDKAGAALATVETGADGTGVFPAVGPGVYELAEVRAPQGYAPADATSVTIGVDGASDGRISLTASVEGAARLVDVDTNAGMVRLEVVDPPVAAAASPAAVGQTAGGQTAAPAAQPQAAESRTLPQTGDVVPVAAVAAAIAAAGACAVAMRRRAAHGDGASGETRSRLHLAQAARGGGASGKASPGREEPPRFRVRGRLPGLRPRDGEGGIGARLAKDDAGWKSL